MADSSGRRGHSRAPDNNAPDNNAPDDGDQTTINLVGAMARVAPARAVEMAEQLPERKHLRAKAYASLIGELLAPRD